MIFARQNKGTNPFRIPIKRTGFRNSFLKDLYHYILIISWFEFFVANTSLYLLQNSFFGLLYFWGGDNIVNAQPGSYWDAFMFSFQTSTTIGYGHMLPATPYAHGVMILDTLSGIIFVAITTGLAFSRFSRPTANVLFTEKAVVHSYEGKETLFFRVANARNSHIVDATIEASVVLAETSSEGVVMQRIRDLQLVRSKNPIFVLSWTVMHVIDDKSPLKMSAQELKDKNARIVISLRGIDDWSSQMVHTSHLYRFNEIIYNKKMADILTSNSDGSVTMDYRKFNDLNDLPQ